MTPLNSFYQGHQWHNMPRPTLLPSVTLFLSSIGRTNNFLLETFSSCASVTAIWFSPYLTGDSFSVSVESSLSLHLKSKCGTTLWPSFLATLFPYRMLPSAICLLMTHKCISSTQAHSLLQDLHYWPPTGHFSLDVELMSNAQLGQNGYIDFHLVSDILLIES